jgi:hypothetical protein
MNQSPAFISSDGSVLGTACESLIQIAGGLPRVWKEMLLTVFHASYLLVSVFMILRTGIRIVRHRGIECIIGISDIGPALISTFPISRRTGVPYVLCFFEVYVGNNLLPINDLFD